MGRRLKTIRPIEKNISIEETLVAQVDLKLYSEVEGRVPHGSWSKYVNQLIKDDIEGKKVKPLQTFWLLLNGDYANTDGWADFYVTSFKSKPSELLLVIAGVPEIFVKDLIKNGEATDGEYVTWKLREEILTK